MLQIILHSQARDPNTISFGNPSIRIFYTASATLQNGLKFLEKPIMPETYVIWQYGIKKSHPETILVPFIPVVLF
jgi:hypothetical protein